MTKATDQHYEGRDIDRQLADAGLAAEWRRRPVVKR
ncbi:hypothetical protein SAMN05216259_10313 [Actinacidiphila guanduensis]|uniref:Uncharacterized protein n=1 Tax=Actinacidiphila guanduensis TaxID=310781 RepID=A0A1G9Z5A7_9ACTN|nr:hypothetical protein SAMN05216259_10313 [Actinacidiphila guanduensis]